jgi:glycine/D-amino acid oxidase-like deaminating enzyme
MSVFEWDPEIDTPATIAVIGGGPCGVEAALYARFLGYSVELYDMHKVGDSLVQWGDRSMNIPWRALVSSLGLAAMEAHEHPLPELDRIPTYREYVESYLLPIARNDLLYSTVSVHTRALSISRLGCDENEAISIERRAEQEFRLLLSSSQRGQFSQVVDIVLDCSGNQSVRRGLATGGIKVDVAYWSERNPTSAANESY